LLIGINEPHGDIADAFSFDCEVSGKGRFTAATFLGCDYDCFHENHRS
jgi:hypothetical protein